ncbi:hypothetical protein AB5J55_01005 [Streptomyces sp. R11]|uniref:Uncharacterized protein n=1 Tax=Streptomyces sp. R11 TaxID=3238625 RepID=A0AB39MTD7_9ACTN
MTCDDLAGPEVQDTYTGALAHIIEAKHEDQPLLEAPATDAVGDTADRLPPNALRSFSVTMTPAQAPRSEAKVVQVDATDAARLGVIVRCLATTRLGARFRCTSRDGHDVDLVVAEIRRYPKVTVDEVDPPHGARLALTGAGANDLHLKPGDIVGKTKRAA